MQKEITIFLDCITLKSIQRFEALCTFCRVRDFLVPEESTILRVRDRETGKKHFFGASSSYTSVWDFVEDVGAFSSSFFFLLAIYHVRVLRGKG